MPAVTFEGGKNPYPTGTICIWNGAPDKIPAGWLFCDGNNGTPDLRDRFPMSVPDGSTDPGGIGGQHSYTLSTSQLPSHSHTGSTSTDGSHQHGMDQNLRVGYTNHKGLTDDNNATSSTDGAHSHNASVGNTGSGASIDNRPKYYAAIFIQRA